MANSVDINKAISILEKALEPYSDITNVAEESVMVTEEEIQAKYPESPELIGKFYVYVGLVAVINDIEILSPEQMKNSLGYSELTEVLKVIFEEADRIDLLPTVDNSSSVFNTVYSKTSLFSFGDTWGTHTNADIASVLKLIDKDSKPTEPHAYKNLRDYFDEQGDSAKFKYDAEVDNILGFLRDTYESTYQLIKPKGILLPTTDERSKIAMLTLKGSDGKVDYMEGTNNLFRVISKTLADTFNLSDEIEINISEDNFSIPSILKSNKKIFFVRPHLKLLFGRNLFSNLGENGKFTTPSGKRKYPTWASAEDNVRKFVERAYQNLIIYHFRQKAKDWYDIDAENNNMSDALSDMDNIDAVIDIEDTLVKDFYKLSSSIITTYFVSEFGGTVESPAKISIRGTFNENNVESEDLFTTITQESGKRITTESKIEFTPRKVLQEVPLNDLLIYQYDHTFNQAAANAVPLFAAKALDYIEQNIAYQKSKNPNVETQAVSWENLLVGMSKDGFIEQGQGNVTLMKHIVHWLSAGSRAGKGVASYNLILPQILEDRLTFYNDRKPDTAIVLAQHAGLRQDGTPNLALVNGGQWGEVSPENEKFIAWQEKLIAKNKPKWLKIDSRKTLDDLVYLRQGMIVLSVIHMITTEGIQNVNTKLGFDPLFIKGVTAIFDEYTNFQKEFLESLDPFTRGSMLQGVLNEDIFELISEEGSDPYKKVEAKGIMKNINMFNTWKLDLINSLLDANTHMTVLKNAGIQQIADFIDVLVIGQGFRGELSPLPFDIQKGKMTGEYIKAGRKGDLNTLGAAKDPFTTLLKIIPNHDYILGTPPEPEGGQNYDLLDVKGRGNQTYGQYLNRNYRGFAYISNDTLVQDPNGAFVFKPFLLLNEGSEPQELKAMAKSGKRDVALMDEMISKYKNKPGGYLSYLAKEVDNIKGTSWLEVRKELEPILGLDQSHESLAGVIPYAERIGFDKSKYSKTIDFMNAVVKAIGYTGTWHEFVCDLRPEWMIGITDLHTGVFGGQQAFQERETIQSTRLYVTSSQYNSDKDIINKDLIGLGKLNQDDDDMLDVDDDLTTGFDDDFTDGDFDDITEDTTEDTNLLDDTPIGIIPDGEGGLPTGFADDLGVDGFGVDGFEESEDTDPIPTEPEVPFTQPEPESTESDVFDDSDRGTETEPEPTEDDLLPDYEEEERKRAEADKQKEEEMTSEQREYYYMGVKDVMEGKTAFASISELMLESNGMKEFYELGYRTSFKGSPKRLRIESVCSTNLPQAVVTRRVLGLQKEPDRVDMSDLLGETTAPPVDKSDVQNPRDIFKEVLSRYIPARTLAEIENEYGHIVNQESKDAYGLKDTYVVGGKTGTISNLDTAITSQYTMKTDPETGKYDPDETLASYIQSVTEQIINKVGSYRQFHSIIVTSNGQMIVNEMLRMSFAIPKEEYNRLPWGIKTIVDNQEWAKLFSWGELRKMPSLSELHFDSKSFVMSYIRPFLKVQNTIVDQSLLLREFEQVFSVAIEGEAVTRTEIKPLGYWSGFKLKSESSNSDFKNYTAQRFDNMKTGVQSSYNKDKEYRRAFKNNRQAELQAQQQYIDDAPTRAERMRRKQEVKMNLSNDGMKNAFKEKNFRRIISETGYSLATVPGLLVARVRTSSERRRANQQARGNSRDTRPERPEPKTRAEKRQLEQDYYDEEFR